MNLDKSIKIVMEHIEENLGGNVVVTKNPIMVIFNWSKNEKTLVAQHFQYAYSYEELEKAINPVVLGEQFVEAYLHPKEPVEEPKKKSSRAKKVEEVVEPVVEEPKPEENG